jgi:hypothetical protein
VGARIDDRASLLAGLSWLWVSAGCAAVLVPGVLGVWLLTRSSPAPAAPRAAIIQPAAVAVAKIAAPVPVEIEPLAHLPAMMPEPEPAAAPVPRTYPGGRYYHRRRGGLSRRAAALAAVTGGPAAAPEAPGAGAPSGAAGTAPAGNAAQAGVGAGAGTDSPEPQQADEPEKAPEKPKRVVEAAPEEQTAAPPRTVKELRAALARLQGRVVQCHQRFQVDGVADVRVAVNPSGTVESAALAGEFEGTPTGDCIVRALTAASFPTFDGTESVRVSHSFPLQ